MRATTDRRPNAAGGREEEGPVPRSGSSSKVREVIESGDAS